MKNRPFKLVKVLSITSYTLSAGVNLSTFGGLGSMLRDIGGDLFLGVFSIKPLFCMAFMTRVDLGQ